MERESRPIGRPRQGNNGKSTKVLILDEATRMYLNKGYQSVSMDDVANECGVTKATIYYHYKTKADLFTDAMLELMLRIKQRSIQILSTDKLLKEKLKEIAAGHLRATADIDINSFMKEAKTSIAGKHLEQLEVAENNMYGVLEDAFTFAIETKEISPCTPKLAAHAFMAFLTAGKKFKREPDINFTSYEDLAKQIVDFYWNGLGHK